MITNNVVLVLGAGASRPYRFPVGKELRQEALKPIGEADNLDNKLYEIGVTKQELKDFREVLRESLAPSIDACLETRDEFEELGKKIIAYLLILREDPDRLFLEEDNTENPETWYGTLFNNFMRSHLSQEFAYNKLRIITYNYDRSLEFCLLRALKATYRLPRQKCIELLEHIQIIHLHGMLGALPGMGDNSREYSTDTSPEQLMIATEIISIVSKVDPNDSRFRDAHEALKNAQHVVFLGFGYYPDNVDRLDLENHCKQATQWGTCKGLSTPVQRQSITSQIPKLRGRHLEDESVNMFLRNHPDIFGKP